MKKKYTFLKVFSFLVLVLGLVVFNSVRVFADNEQQQGGGDQKGEVKIDKNNESDMSNNGGGEYDNEISDEENSIHSNIVSIEDLTKLVSLPEIDPVTINTYADVSVQLKNYSDALDKLKNSDLIDKSMPSNLTDSEKTLLTKLMGKHSGDFNRMNTRIDELQKQINDLNALLSPLGSQPISDFSNLKELLVSQLEDFRSAINDLSNLGDISINSLNEEFN